MPSETSDGSENGVGAEEIIKNLPFQFLKYQQIPPSPNRSETAIDWLHDFAGFSWIAYGASSLLVISQTPSPQSQYESEIGPVFRQIIEPPSASNDSLIVRAVAWCPSLPSDGTLAVGSENCICLYAPSSGNLPGSFCWSQIARLVQSSKVDALEWTGSGDGIIAAGVEVVLWKKKNNLWEVAWKSSTELPQTLVSATWSIEGPAATAAHGLLYSSDQHVRESTLKDIRTVTVWLGDEKSGFLKVELCHPRPVSMIQWRPRRSKYGASYYQRDVLLTCCFDGVVRLWNEINSGKPRKSGRDINDRKIKTRSFHVTAVIEINQCLNGNLCIDTFVRWTNEIRGVIAKGEEATNIFSTEDSKSNVVGKCEWLVGVGPGASITFWAVHCLDDISPLRFPRVNLWTKNNDLDSEARYLCEPSNLDSENCGCPIFVKAVIMRSQLFGPPNRCSLLRLLPNSSISCLHLFSDDANEASSVQMSNEKSLSCFASGVLSLEGHSGNILQVAVHPYCCELDLAVSLDSNGCILFWSLATILGMPTVVHPPWKFLGKIFMRDLPLSLTWAPSVLDESRLLLIGHSRGIDCTIIKISKGNKNLEYHKMCTIPFSDHPKGPDRIFATALPTTCQKTFISNSFMLIAIWFKGFRALSWKVVLHSEELSGKSCGCKFSASFKGQRYESTFSGRRYCVITDICSSLFPDPQDSEQVTSCAVVFANFLLPCIQQKWPSFNGFCSDSYMYHMATGYSNGSIKLWRIISQAESSSAPWELVGMFDGHQGPVNMISLSNDGCKIATVSMTDKCNGNYLHIWDSVGVLGVGSFLLEDKISLDGVVIALDWLAIGNGQLLLGVCMQNEIRVYAKKRCDAHVLENSGKLFENQIWFSIAISHNSVSARDFVWGPRGTAVLVHRSYFSVLSQWLFSTDRKNKIKLNQKYGEDHHVNSMDARDESKFCAIYTDNTKNDYGFHDLCSTIDQHQFDYSTRGRLISIQELAEKLRGYLPIYHPKALFWCLCSGKWKRAYVAVRHLVSYINSKESSLEKPCLIVPQLHLSNYFQDSSSMTTCDKGLTWGNEFIPETSTQRQEQFLELVNFSENLNSTSGKSDVIGLIRTLENSGNITGITSMERTQILAILDLLNEVNDPHRGSPYESFDKPGRRFWVAIRFQHLHFLRKFGRSAGTEDLVVSSGLIAWAFQSDCQENLFNSILSSEPSWPEMRNLGVGFWFTSATSLWTRMEKLARLQYLKKRDPKDCAILYLALNRLQVLTGLFKISKDEKDKPLVGFLSRNFQEEKNKAAALKNAYVLLGRHQLELAIAFFLLGGDHLSAVTVCAKNLGDEQLALVICRLMEGYGGPLERDLISNYLLPNAIEKGDHWICSVLEWTLGNYTRSFLHLLGSDLVSTAKRLDIVGNSSAFSDPNIGQYCAILASKSCMRNSIGDSKTLMLARWATLMTSYALDRCGLALEALECLSSSSTIPDCNDQGILSDTGKFNTLDGILNPCPEHASFNWLSGDVARSLESNIKLNLAMSYVSKLIAEHPSWSDTDSASSGTGAMCNKEHETQQYELQLDRFNYKLSMVLSILEQRYTVNIVDVMNMILIFSCNNGMLFLGYHMLHGYTSSEDSWDKHHVIDKVALYPLLTDLLLKASKEMFYVFARYITACNLTNYSTGPTLITQNICGESSHGQFCPWDFYLPGLLKTIRSFQPLLKVFSSGFLPEDLTMRTLDVLNLLEYSIYYASTWLQRNSKGLVQMIRPILNTFSHENSSAELKTVDLKKLCQRELMINNTNCCDVNKQLQHEQNGLIFSSISENERWKLLGVCLWLHLFNFSKARLYGSTQHVCEDEYSFKIPVLLAKFLMNTLGYISSALTKELASFLRQKLEKGLPVPSLMWLHESIRGKSRGPQSQSGKEIDRVQVFNNEKGLPFFKILWEISVDPKEICKSFVCEKINSFNTSRMISKCWNDINEGTVSESEKDNDGNYDLVGRINSISVSREAGIPAKSWPSENYSFMGTRHKDSITLTEDTCFQNPKEVVKRNGELLEAICVNSCDQAQVALASNRKGLLFFKWEFEEPFREQAEYIWAESDWPKNGWAGTESTPIPTFVSPGIGLGSKKGAHLGLGGATVGLGSLARPGKDLTGGGAFGIPGYAGMGASGLGWGEQEDFEEFVDAPATIENISTRALSSHPLLPLLLVGSSNTHIYLWEFGKDKATATYGVLPAANVPPPYALASISALRFDHSGHRFVTAALDGTVCTWQLEVGGRSNVCPTESSLCFNSHASDVAYVSSSGSIVAAAGSSPNGVNVVIWDTLAPPSTSRASLTCHEGGAHSLSVFDHDIGSSSISPLIVTGGKGGDVGLHDFRFIATGKAKRHRHSKEQITKPSSVDNLQKKFGEQNLNGMLWHIPKAHLGSVTSISTIPDTSLFLTGSKDGDVKLWDAKKCELVFHWQKLHERHTFLQPNSPGFGVVRAGVTDIQILTHGFLSCGGDGSVKHTQLKNFHSGI